MSYKYINFEENPHRLDIIINNPPVNILTGAVMREMIAALREAEQRNDIRVLVLKGEGKAWSAGADVSEHLPGKFEEMLEVFGELCELLRTYPIPTIAAVDGLCLGGGCEVAAMCDFIIASDRSKFGQPEIKVGVFPPVACAHFARKYGYANALEIILAGDTYSAEDAYRMGMVSRVTPGEQFAEAVERFAGKLTAHSGLVLRSAKEAVLEAFKSDPDNAVGEASRIYSEKLMTTGGAVEGLTAFLEKRQPEWKDE